MPSFPPVWSSTNEFLPSRLTLINWLIGKFDVKIANKKSRHFVKIFCHRNQAGFPPLTQTPYDNLIISEVTESSSSHQLGEGPEGTPPPPLLPPKTRKLPGVAQAGLTPLSGQVVTGSQQGNNTKRHQLPAEAATLEPVLHSHLLDSPGVSVVRISSLNRSASSVASSQARLSNKVTKPVRRSKSQLPARGGKFVTSITHGGSVTLVSLNDQQEPESREFQPIDPDITPR